MAQRQVNIVIPHSSILSFPSLCPVPFLYLFLGVWVWVCTVRVDLNLQIYPTPHNSTNSLLSHTFTKILSITLGIFVSGVPPSPRRKTFETVNTLFECFNQSVRLYPNRPFLGHRPVTVDPATGTTTASGYAWKSYKEVDERRTNFGSGLVKIKADILKLSSSAKLNLGIYAVRN
jgi:hypothetical protein